MNTRLLTPLLFLAFGAAAPSITAAAPASPAPMVAAGHQHRARHHAPPRPAKHPKKVEHPKKKT